MGQETTVIRKALRRLDAPGRATSLRIFVRLREGFAYDAIARDEGGIAEGGKMVLTPA